MLHAIIPNYFFHPKLMWSFLFFSKMKNIFFIDIIVDAHMKKAFKSGLSKFCGRQPLKNLLGPFSNALFPLVGAEMFLFHTQCRITISMVFAHGTKKWSFPLRIFSVNVTKSTAKNATIIYVDISNFKQKQYRRNLDPNEVKSSSLKPEIKAPACS